ncbi:MAG TPA: T9SS type A sorting domain-containing protein [Bacteroidia bacterium]
MNTKLIKLLLNISVFFFVVKGNAQYRMTNREIYSFEVGDVIHFSHFSTFSNVTQFVKREFIDKQLSSDQDSLTFIVLDSIYTLISIPNFKLNVKTDTIYYSDLDSFPSPLVSDTSLLDDCGTLLNSANYKIKSNKGYNEIYRDYYYEGLGRYFRYEIDSDQTRSEKTSLEYYKTTARECGRRVGNLGVHNVRSWRKLTFYPNPANSKITIEDIDKSSYEIYNAAGEVVQKGEVESEISIFDLESGYYFIKIISSNMIYTGQLFKL